jgi:hypothetical protein
MSTFHHPLPTVDSFRSRPIIYEAARDWLAVLQFRGCVITRPSLPDVAVMLVVRIPRPVAPGWIGSTRK